MKLLKKIVSIFLLCALLLPALALAEPVIYKAKTISSCYLKSEKDSDSKNLDYINEGVTISITDVDAEWLTVSYNGQTGYLLRSRIDRATPVDEANTPPYDVHKTTYIATLKAEAPVYSQEGELLHTLGAGSRISILALEDGQAVIPYYRTLGYIDSNLLEELIPVSTTDTPFSAETPIASFTTYYDYTTPTEDVQGRVVNLEVSCQYLSRVVASGRMLDYNEEIGPFTRARGYLPGPVFADGTTKMGLGGGTCQVSSTLYNVLLQLPGINVIERRTHGRYGSVYLPVGMDSSVGTDTLNLIFRNQYEFDIRIEAVATGGALFITFWRVN